MHIRSAAQHGVPAERLDRGVFGSQKQNRALPIYERIHSIHPLNAKPLGVRFNRHVSSSHHFIVGDAMPKPIYTEIAIPEIVRKAIALAPKLGFPLMPEGRQPGYQGPPSACIPQVGRLLQVLSSSKP